MPAFLIESASDRLRASLKGQQRCLAIRVDMGGVSAAVYSGSRRKGEKQGTLGVTVRSTAGDFPTALADALEQLALAENGPLPRQVHLAAQMVLPSVVELPVDPARPRKDKDMRVLVLTETEAAHIHFNGLWTIGALLMARGMLSAEQCTAVAQEQQMQRAAGGRSALFGEIAVGLGYVERSDLEAALRVQERLQNLEMDLACAWQPAQGNQGSKGNPGKKSGGTSSTTSPGQHRWLACTTPEDRLNEWRDACRRLGLTLDGIWPLAWCALPVAVATATAAAKQNDSSAPTTEHAIVQLHSEEWAVIYHTGGSITATHSEPRMGRMPEARALATLLETWRFSPYSNVELQAWDPAWSTERSHLPQLAEQLSTLLALRQPVSWTDSGALQSRIMTMLGGKTPGGKSPGRLPRQGGVTRIDIPGLPGREPFEFSAARLLPMARYLLPVAALLTAGGLELHERMRLQEIKKVFAETEKKSKDNALLASNEQRLKTEITGKRHTLDAASIEYEKRLNENLRLANIANMRHNLPDLIRALARSSESGTVIDKVANSVAENNAAQIQVVAWSPDYGQAQHFAARAQDEVARLGFSVALTEIGVQKGRNAQDGYRISFWLVPSDGDFIDDADKSEDKEKIAEKNTVKATPENRTNPAHPAGEADKTENSGAAAPSSTAASTPASTQTPTGGHS